MHFITSGGNRLITLSLCLLFVFVACSSEKLSGPSNSPPRIISDSTVYATEDERFSFAPAFIDADGPDTIVAYQNIPSWLSSIGDSLIGTPGEGISGTGFVVIVSDSKAADTLQVTLIVTPVNDSPVITSKDSTEAAGGIFYSYRATFVDADGPQGFIEFRNYPSWLTVGSDSLFGIPPDGVFSTNFVVVVSDGFLSDTQSVLIETTPCIVVYGDTRTGHDQHRQLVSLIRQNKPSAIFHVGDLVNDGTLQSDWDIFNSIVAEMLSESEFYPALGNHEKQSPLYFSNFDLPGNEQWYSVETNRTHFTILNTCVTTGPASEQYKWLEADLASVSEAIEFIVAVFHHPPYSTGAHPEDEMQLRQTLVPLFEQYGVDICFTGHDHDYERSFCGGIYYIVTGGGGAPLRDQTRTHPCSQLFVKQYEFCKLSMVDNRLVVKVFDINSQLIDQFEIGH